MKFKVKPAPAVRVNGKMGRFTKRAKEYHNKMNNLREIIGDNKQEVIELLLSGEYELNFYIPMPNSWSKKKKEQMNLMPHQAKPDIDNIYKFFSDSIFYGTDYNDSGVYRINCIKFRCEEEEYGIEIIDTNN